MIQFQTLTIIVPLSEKILTSLKMDDGCPDIVDYLITGDTDGDGIPNQTDLCPYNKETYNKFEDWDGCPDLVADGIVYNRH